VENKMENVKKENVKVNEIRKELKSMLVCTYRHYASKDMKEKRVDFLFALSNIQIKSNKNGDFYAPITNEALEGVQSAMFYFASDCVCEAMQTLDPMTFKKCVSVAYIDAFTQRHNKDGNLVDVVRGYELIKMLSYNIWQKAKEIAKKNK
jgi:hypothetical protein